MKTKTAILILAAGKSTRMKSDIIKVLHKVSGKYIIEYVLEKIRRLKIDDTYIIAGYQAASLQKIYKNKYNFVIQKEQLGTGHAVEVALKHVKKNTENVIVLNGDMPLIEEEDIRNLFNFHLKTGSDASILTVEQDSKTDFGRIIRNKFNRIEKIVEVKDANDEQLKIREVNSGIYCFKIKPLKTALSKIGFENKQKEKYLTDTISYLVKNNFNVNAYVSENKNLALGINTRIDLAKVNTIINRKKLETLMIEGVTIIDPSNTFIHDEVKIASDSIVNPFTIIEGKTSIGKNCVIGPFARIVDSKIGENVSAENAVIMEAEVKNNTTIGPFSYLRPGALIENNVKIGDFVEIKKSKIGSFSKVPHLSYIGDAVVGKNVNIGAGVITCNYDGIEKHKTIISDNCFIGANSNLVAPVKIGKGSKTGAGSVVTKDIQDKTLAVGMPARAIKKIKSLR